MVFVRQNVSIHTVAVHLIEPFRHVAPNPVESWMHFWPPFVSAVPWMFDFRPSAPDWRTAPRSAPSWYCSGHLRRFCCASVKIHWCKSMFCMCVNEIDERCVHTKAKYKSHLKQTNTMRDNIVNSLFWFTFVERQLAYETRRKWQWTTL